MFTLKSGSDAFFEINGVPKQRGAFELVACDDAFTTVKIIRIHRQDLPDPMPPTAITNITNGDTGSAFADYAALKAWFSIHVYVINQVEINNADGTPIEISVPNTVATAAKQDIGNASLASIDSKTPASPATTAKQDTGNSSLASIDGKVATASKQDIGNSSLSSIDTKVTGIGAVSDSAATDSTSSWSIIALLKGIYQWFKSGTNAIGNVGGFTGQFASALLGNNKTYAAGQSIGGLITLTNAMRIANGTGLLQSLFICQYASTLQIQPIKILLLNAIPSSSTFTDNVAASLAAADAAKVIREINIATSDWTTVLANQLATVDLSPGGRCLAAAGGSQDLYMVIIAGGAITYPNTANYGIIARLGILRD